MRNLLTDYRSKLLCSLFVFVAMFSSRELKADAITDYNLAVQFYKQERWSLAAEACEEFVKKYPDHVQAPMAQLYWGQSLVHLRDFKLAREKFKTYLNDSRAKTDRALAMYRVGESSYFLNDLQAAEKELTTFLSTYPEHELAEWATVYLGQSQFQLNKIPQSITSFQRALAKYENSPLKSEAQYGLARAYEADGQAENAIELYLTIIEMKDDPQAASALFHLAALNFSLGDFAQADQRFQQFMKEYPEHRLVQLAALNAGYVNYQLKQFKEAIGLFEQAGKADSQKLNSLYWTGLSHKSLGDYQTAVEVFQTAIDLGQDQPLIENISFQAGDAQLRLKNYPEAIRYFSSVYKNFPESEYADDALHSACEAALQANDLTKAAELNALFEERYANSGLRIVQDLLYGRILIAMGDQANNQEAEQKTFYQKAAEILQNVVNSTSVEETQNFARFQLARTYERLDETEKLITTLEPFLASSDDLSGYAVDSLLLLANAKLRRDQFPEAIKDYQRLLEVASAPELKRATYQGLTSAFISTGDWQEVGAKLEKLRELDTQDKYVSQLALAAGDAAFDAEAWQAAENFFRLGSSREVDNKYYLASLSGLGYTLYKLERYPQAAEIFEKLSTSVLADPKLGADSFYMLGLSLQKAEKPAEALAAYQAGLDKYDRNIEEQPVEFQKTVYGLAKFAARAARDAEMIPKASGFYQQAFDLIQLMPEESEAQLDKFLIEWADIHYNAEEYAKADEIYQKLIDQFPDSPLADDAALILAESALFSGEDQKAEQAFRKLTQNELADEFTKQRAYIHLIDLGAEAEEWQQVLADAQTVQRDYPENKHQLYLDYRIAEASLQLQKLDVAREKLEALQQKIESLDQAAPSWWEEVWILHAQVLLQLKDYSELSAAVEDLRQRSPDSKVIHRADLLLGRSLENQAKFEEARTAYTRAIESETGKGTETAAEAQFRIAESYLKQNNFETAFKEYYKVYTGYDSPGYESAALFQAARSDAKMKNWKGAVQTFKILLEEFPESEYATEARKQLAEIEAAFPELKSGSK